MSDELERARLLGKRSERPATYEEALRRNSVERLKQEKGGLEVIHDLPRLMQMEYEAIPEEDILRLQWYGLYHDKPKVGHFMLRVKLPNGLLTPAKLRVIGQLSVEHGRGSGELTTRQDIQIHWLRLDSIPDIFARLAAAGMTTAGGCGDNLRNITGCPVTGISPEEAFDPTPTILALADHFYGNPAYSNLPRKHKWSISACPYHCNVPEIHDVGLVGTRQAGQDGFAIWVGGGLSSVPRVGKSLGAFITLAETEAAMTALLEAWQTDMRWRMSRAKARFKFMVDEYGPEKVRELIEAKLGRRLTDLEENPVPVGRTDHLGIHPQKQPGLFWIGFPVFPSNLSGEQLIAIADVVDSYGGEVRLTREQNLIVSHVPEALLPEVEQRMAGIGLTLAVNRLRGTSIGCTGEPYCNFAVGETKGRIVEIVDHLEARFGERVSDLRLYLDGCPHACGQHWVGDIGFQGTTGRATDGGKIQAYDIILRGGLGRDAEIGRPLLRRVPSEEVTACVERLVAAYLDERRGGEPLQAFYRRHSDEELVAIATGQELAATA
jgi:ferredoxin-nitrite reductase